MNSTELAIATTPDDLARLSNPRNHPAVSLLMPPTPREEGRIVLRNLANDAVNRLELAGLRSVEARERMGVVDRILEDHELWASPEVTLALYVTEEAAWRAAGPATGSPHTVVGPRAQIKHLLDSTPRSDHAVLALSLKSAHLYRSSAEGFAEVDEHGLPVTMADVLRYDDPETQLQHHATGSNGRGKLPMAFHGHGAGKDTRDEEMARYMRAVAAAVERSLAKEPLVIAATEEVAAAFRRITGYGNLLGREISGSGERRSIAELRDAAHEIVDEAMRRHRDEVRGRIEERMDTGDVAVDLAEVVLAACEGRVEAIFVAGGSAAINGRYQPEHRSVELATDGEDLINLAAVETWTHGGEVFVVANGDMPARQPAVGLLRY